MDTSGNQTGPGALALDRSAIGHGRVCVAVAGGIDISTVERLREAIAGIPTEPELTGLVLDLGGLEFIDSSGVGALVRAKQEAASRGVSFTVSP